MTSTRKQSETLKFTCIFICSFSTLKLSMSIIAVWQFVQLIDLSNYQPENLKPLRNLQWVCQVGRPLAFISFSLHPSSDSEWGRRSVCLTFATAQYHLWRIYITTMPRPRQRTSKKHNRNDFLAAGSPAVRVRNGIIKTSGIVFPLMMWISGQFWFSVCCVAPRPEAEFLLTNLTKEKWVI